MPPLRSPAQSPRAARLVRLAALAFAAPAVLIAAPAHAQPCAQERDDARRLACYDARFGKPPGEPADDQTLKRMPVQTAHRPVVGAGLAQPGNGRRLDSPLSRVWELDAADKEGSFRIKSYRPIYLLPAHYTDHQGPPVSPTQPNPPADYSLPQHLEAKFQISLRTKLLEDVGLPGGDLWAAYTQVTMWQLYDREESSAFRSTDHQPELIYVAPIPERFAMLPGGWRWRMAQFGFAHQSNGQRDPLSRSWNRVYLGTSFERGPLSIGLRRNERTDKPGDGDNTDLVSYLGRDELLLGWLTRTTQAALLWRTSVDHPKRGFVQFDWSYPVGADNPDGLRWHVQLFSGYGQTLLDYNRRQTSIGLGFSLYQF